MVLQFRASDCSHSALKREKSEKRKKRKTHNQKNLSHDPVTFVTQFYNLIKKKKNPEFEVF